MHRLSRDRFSAWEDLDALVGAELDALDRRRPEPEEASEQPPAFDAPDFVDEPFDAADDDEEAFIERTAAWLRDRPDADALIDAIRAALDEVAEAPAETPSSDVAADAEAPADEIAGEQ